MFIRFCGLLWYFSGEVKVMLACTCILSASGMLYLIKWCICHDKKLLLMILDVLEEGVNESNSEAAVTLISCFHKQNPIFGVCLD